jgi:outer membrane protein
MSVSLRHAIIAILTAVSLAFSPLYAQDGQSQVQTQKQAGTASSGAQTATLSISPAATRTVKLGPDYSRGPRWLPDFTLPYRPRRIPQPALANSADISQLIQDGKLMLSLEDAISLALENNLNIAVARYTPWLDEANLLFSKSGANGLTKFDPLLTSTLEQERYSTPINNVITTDVGGVATLIPAGSNQGHFTIANAGYSQGFHYGTTVSVTMNTTRETSNLQSFQFDPWVQSYLTIQITQPLLSGFGRRANTRFIIEAKNTAQVGEAQFAQQVMATVTQASNDYWELVFAGENVKVEEMSVGTDTQLYENNKKQLEIGTLAPLDVVTAESQLAADQQALVQAQTTQLLDETTLLNDITKNPEAVSVAGVEIVPTTPITTPEVENISVQDAVAEAWQKRPELREAELNLKNAGVEVKATRNALLPTLNLFGLYQAAGLSGTPTKAGTPGGGGLPTDLRNMIDGNNPTIEGGINFSVSIRNRAAQGQNAIAMLNERQQKTEYRQEQNTIFLNVRTTMIALQQDRAAVAAAGKARDLAQQSYDAEVKKFQLGSSTPLNVVIKQQQLTSAQGIELRDRINLIEAEVNFNQALGRTLDVNNISMADARTGKISPAPNIPGAMDAAMPTSGAASQ